MSTFTFTARRAAYLEAARAAACADGHGFRSEAQRKEALQDLGRCYDEAKEAHSAAVRAAAPALTDPRNPSDAEWRARCDFIHAADVADYLVRVKDSHLAIMAKFNPAVADAVSGLLEIFRAVKVAPIKAVETKAAKARAAAALVTPDRNTIAAAVAPMKADAITRAAQDAADYAAKVEAALIAAGNDIDIAAPYPKFNEGRAKAEAMKARRSLFFALTEGRDTPRGAGWTDLRDMSAEGLARFIDDAKAAAAVHYDSFVAKLAAKIGECSAAEITGNHVWGYSILTVTKADTGAIERWKTQQIVNYSVYGKAFNQWPSRKVK